MIEALSLLPFCFLFPVATLGFDLGNWVDVDPNPCLDERGLLVLGVCSSKVGFEDCEES